MFIGKLLGMIVPAAIGVLLGYLLGGCPWVPAWIAEPFGMIVAIDAVVTPLAWCFRQEPERPVPPALPPQSESVRYW